jgi:hypothetical protein
VGYQAYFGHEIQVKPGFPIECIRFFVWKYNFLLAFGLSFLSLLDSTGFWTQGSMLAKEVFLHLSHTSNPFCSGYLWYGVSQSICLTWPFTVILLISSSQVVRITGITFYLSLCGNHSNTTDTIDLWRTFHFVWKLKIAEPP